MLITVDVTQKHIDLGVKGDCDKCPIWYAASPRIRKDWFIAIYGDHYVIYDKKGDPVHGDEWMMTSLPIEAMEFISNFDTEDAPGREKAVKPFSFELEIPMLYVIVEPKAS